MVASYLGVLHLVLFSYVPLRYTCQPGRSSYTQRVWRTWAKGQKSQKNQHFKWEALL
jgi:hypothetical protein